MLLVPFSAAITTQAAADLICIQAGEGPDPSIPAIVPAGKPGDGFKAGFKGK